MSRNCAYTCTDSNGDPITLIGPSALKTFLVEEGLETLFPERDFTALKAAPAPPPTVDRRKNLAARDRYEKHKARKAANAKLASELRFAKRELRTNPTTGVPNKRAFFEGDVPKYVASIDIDSLKYVNDNMGHAAGDDLLRIAARVLAKHVDAYHVSGDEIWAKGSDRATLEKGLQDAVAELRSGAYKIVADSAIFSKPGFSYGVAATDTSIEDTHELLESALKKADLTMLDQKEAREKTGERAPRGEAPDGFVRNTDPEARTVVPQRPVTDNFSDSQAATVYLANIFGTGVTRLVNGGVITFTRGKEAWPAETQRGLRGDEHAVYWKGRAYIDLDAATRESLPGVVLHEIGEHFNLARMLGSKAYAALQSQIRNQAKIANSPAAKVWAEVKRNYPQLVEGDEGFIAEVIAKLGERNPRMPWYRRLLAQIKSFLINHGLGKAFIAGTMTDKDLHALLVTSLKSAAKRGRMNEARLYDSTRDEDREVRMSRPDTAPPPSEPVEPSTWEKTKTKLANMGDAAFSERLAFLSAIQVSDIAEKVIPYAKNYVVGMRNRRREIDTWLRKADQIVSKWRGLLFPERAALNKVMHASTLADMDASLDWSGIKETEVPSYFNYGTGTQHTKKYYAYTQAVLSTNAAGKIAAMAGPKALNTTKNGAVFSTSEDAARFLDQLRELERTGGLPTNSARKERHTELRAQYKALPSKAQDVYSETNAVHGELFEAKMKALEDRIHDAIINKAKASELIQAMRAQFESGSLNWYYAPLSRFGKHWFYGVDKDGQNWFRSFESERGRDQAEKEFKKTNGETSIVGHGSNVKDLLNMRTEGTSDAFILSVKHLLEDKLPKELSDDMADDIYQMYLSTLPDVSMRHNAQHRKGTLGFEEDALRSFGFSVHHGASQVANMTHGRQMQKVLSEMEEAIHVTEFPRRKEDLKREIRALEDLEENWENWSVPGEITRLTEDAETDEEIAYADAMSKHYDRVKDDEDPTESLMYERERREHVLEISSQLNADNLRKAVDILNELRANYVAMTMTNSTAMDQIAGFARQLGFTWMLGFGLSSGVMNMAQTPVVAIPIVMGKHGIVPTTKAFNAAYADFAKAVAIMFRKDANGNPTGVDADGNASITQVYRDKLAAGGLSTEESHRLSRLIAALERFKNDGTLSRTQTFDVIGVGQEGETYGGKMQDWSKKMGWMFHQAERANREITLVAAMNLAMDKGMHVDDAMEYAKKVVDDAHGEYSPENAPRIFRGWLPSIALQFKKYPQMMLYLWGKTASDALSGWKKLPPGPERDAAQQKSKEAFGTLGALFLAQVSVAGVFGLPMMGSLGLVLNALANAAGDDDEPDWDWQQELRVGATSLFGETAATALTTGLFNALTPANVGSRMSLAEPVFRPPLQELEGQDAATHYLAEMWGPFGGIIQRLFQSQKLMADGHYMRAAEYATPKFVGDAIKSFRFAKEGAQTINGEPMKDMSAMEELLQLAGFGSSELEKLYAERGYVKSAEAQLQEHRKMIQHSAARAKLEGTEYPMADVVAWNEKHPNWRITAETVKQAMDRIKENRAAKGERGYTVNPKLDYLIEENTLRDDVDDE